MFIEISNGKYRYGWIKCKFASKDEYKCEIILSLFNNDCLFEIYDFLQLTCKYKLTYINKDGNEFIHWVTLIKKEYVWESDDNQFKITLRQGN